MTPTQRTTAEAFAHVFAPGPQTQLVLDTMIGYARSLSDPLVRAGATEMVLYVLGQSGSLRRARRQEAK